MSITDKKVLLIPKLSTIERDLLTNIQEPILFFNTTENRFEMTSDNGQTWSQIADLQALYNLTPAEIGAPTTVGDGASGTWNISISGNAETATTADVDIQDTYTNGDGTFSVLDGKPFVVKGVSFGATTDSYTGFNLTASTFADSSRGYYFTPTANMQVTALQYIDSAFTSGTREVGIYNLATTNLLTSTFVSKSDPLVGGFRTKTITPIQLLAGTQYIVSAVVPAFEQYTSFSVAVPNEITIHGGAYTQSVSTLTYPTNFITQPNQAQAGGFQYQDILSVDVLSVTSDNKVSLGSLSATTLVVADANKNLQPGSLLGDLTTSNLTATLNTVNLTPGSFGSASSVPLITVNGKGLVTSSSAATITPSAIGAPTTGGDGASGTWGISVSGNAASATTANAVTGGYVSSVTGTTNQVNVNTSTGAVTFSLPQAIATTSSPTFTAITISQTMTYTTVGTSSSSYPRDVKKLVCDEAIAIYELVRASTVTDFRVQKVKAADSNAIGIIGIAGSTTTAAGQTLDILNLDIFPVITNGATVRGDFLIKSATVDGRVAPAASSVGVFAVALQSGAAGATIMAAKVLNEAF